MWLIVLCDIAFGLFIPRQAKGPPKERPETLVEIRARILTYEGHAHTCTRGIKSGCMLCGLSLTWQSWYPHQVLSSALLLVVAVRIYSRHKMFTYITWTKLSTGQQILDTATGYRRMAIVWVYQKQKEGDHRSPLSSGRYRKSIGSLTSWSEGRRNCMCTLTDSIMDVL